jgi:transposase
MIMTAVEVVPDVNDVNQLIPMIDQAKENTGQQAEQSLADAGFHNGNNLAECEKREQVIVMPEVQARALEKPYHKDKFLYDVNNDSYLCPCVQILKYVKLQLVRRTMMRIYRGSPAVFRSCGAFGICTKNMHHGRVLQIGEWEGAIRRHRVWMASEEAREAYRRRKEGINRTQLWNHQGTNGDTTLFTKGSDQCPSRGRYPGYSL